MWAAMRMRENEILEADAPAGAPVDIKSVLIMTWQYYSQGK